VSRGRFCSRIRKSLKVLPRRDFARQGYTTNIKVRKKENPKWSEHNNGKVFGERGGKGVRQGDHQTTRQTTAGASEQRRAKNSQRGFKYRLEGGGAKGQASTGSIKTGHKAMHLEKEKKNQMKDEVGPGYGNHQGKFQKRPRGKKIKYHAAFVKRKESPTGGGKNIEKKVALGDLEERRRHCTATWGWQIKNLCRKS